MDFVVTGPTYSRNLVDLRSLGPGIDRVEVMDHSSIDNHGKMLQIKLNSTDRIGTLRNIHTWLLKYDNFKPPVSIKVNQEKNQIEVVEPKTKQLYRFLSKPGARVQSGAGASTTALGESFQAYASAARQKKGRPLESPGEVFEIAKDFQKNFGPAQCDRTLEECKALDDTWLNSGMAIANELIHFLGSGEFVFHRGSKWVKEVDDRFNKYKKDIPNYQLNLNKWNPADIWAQKRTFRFNGDYNNLISFNNYILEHYKNRNMVGVSLKKNENGRPTHQEFNTDAPFKPEWTGERTHPQKMAIFGPNGLFKKNASMDAYSEFMLTTDKFTKKVFEMQWRQFSAGNPASWQGEVGYKGSSAKQGKIGGGLAKDVLKKHGKLPRDYKDPVKVKEMIDRGKYDELIQMMSKNYGIIRAGGDNIQEFRTNLNADDPKSTGDTLSFTSNSRKKWVLGKFLGLQIIAAIHAIPFNKRNEVFGEMVEIAMSSTPYSSAYVKFS